MKLKELLEESRQKALTAQALLEGANPDMEQVEALMGESEDYRKRAEAIQATMAAVDGADDLIKGINAPTNSGLVITEGEADRKLKAKPFTGLGEFLMSVKSAREGSFDQRLLPLRSEDAGTEFGYSLNGALGDQFVGGIVQSAHKGTRKATGLGEDVNSLGGFLVDTDRNNSIMARVYDIGTLLQRVDMVGISANSNGMTFNAENETSRADGSRRGGIRAYWTAEAGTKTASYPSFRQIELKLKKVVGLVYATDELLADANALENWILRNLPEELVFVVEDSIINGSGTGMPKGLLAGAGPRVSVAKEAGQAAATIVSQNVIKMWARMYSPNRRNAVWLIDQSCEPQLMQMSIGVGTGGDLVYMPPGGLSSPMYGTIFGRPVLPVEYCQAVGTQGDIILTDLGAYQMIEKGGIQSASSIHVNFTSDESCFRFVYRCDGQPKDAAALTPKSGGATLAPTVILDTRA
jgi:HK97 family phage major capsid protein